MLGQQFIVVMRHEHMGGNIKNSCPKLMFKLKLSSPALVCSEIWCVNECVTVWLLTSWSTSCGNKRKKKWFEVIDNKLDKTPSEETAAV